jgi:hypothetical protein
MGPSPMFAGRRAGKRASVLVPLFLLAMAAYGQTTFWNAAGAGNFLTAGNWSNGVPDMSTNATIANGTIGTPTVVNLNGSAGSVLDLTLGANDSLNVNLNSSLSIYGASASNGGTITVTAGSGNNTFLELDSNVALTGSGTLTLSYGDHNGNAFVEESGGSFALTNSSTIQGDGIIGNSGLTFANATGGDRECQRVGAVAHPERHGRDHQRRNAGGNRGRGASDLVQRRQRRREHHGQ